MVERMLMKMIPGEPGKDRIAKGGLLGSVPEIVQQEIFYPSHTMISSMPIIIEEYGLVGGAFIVFIYLVFLFSSIRIFRRCPYAFGAFLALGLSFTLVIQAIANMAVNVNLFPVTGVTLPLVSMGGSSFLFTCLCNWNYFECGKKCGTTGRQEAAILKHANEN